MALSLTCTMVSHRTLLVSGFLLLVRSHSTRGVRAAFSDLWRQPNAYPKDFDHVAMYVTQEKVAFTGEKALTSGCGADGRPYKYRGVSHLPALREVLGNRKTEVWIGAVTATTPWKWEDNTPLYQLLGLSVSERYKKNAFRVPGNNVFLCSLHCPQPSFLLLQGIWCACSNVQPETRPAVGTLLLCPGTYEEICGSQGAFSVYYTQLPDGVRWGKLVTVQSSYGVKGFLYKPGPRGQLQLLADVDETAKKGFVCNGTLQEDVRVATHERHLLVSREDAAGLSWHDAKTECESEARNLLTLRPNVDLTELADELKSSQTYWVALSRINVSLWLDGSHVAEPVGFLHGHGHPACLTMSLKDVEPDFSFESCTGVQLQVLCEKDTGSRVLTFTHDSEGNHVITGNSATRSPSMSDTEMALCAVLALLLLLTVTLASILWHRNRCLPPKHEITPHNGASRAEHPPADSHQPSCTMDFRAEGSREDQNDADQKEMTLPVTGSSTCSSSARDVYGYATVNKSKQTRRPVPAGCAIPDSKSPLSSSSLSNGEAGVEYMQVVFPGTLGKQQHAPQQQQQQQQQPDISQIQRPGSIASSEEAYSVLSYRRAIQRAWTGLKRTAYAHVVVRRPRTEQAACKMAGRAGVENDDVGAYDEAQPASLRVPCIDNLYDHADPLKLPERASYPNTSARPAKQSRKSETLV